MYVAKTPTRTQTKVYVLTLSYIALEEHERTFLSSIRPCLLFGSESKVDARLRGTLEWLPTDETYIEWLSASRNLALLVTGQPGYGKSVLAAHVRALVDETLPGTLVCRYFFDGLVPELNDLRSALSSLVFQIATQRRKMIRMVRKAAESAEMHGQPLHRNLERLWRLIKALAMHKRVRSLFIILDAIDECDRKTQTDLIENIYHCLQSESESPIKILLTSRPQSLAVTLMERQTPPPLLLSLEERHTAVAKDVSFIIHERVSALVLHGQCHPAAADSLEEGLCAASEGSFLWTSLTLSLLEQRRLLQPRDVLGVHDHIPRDLGNVYDRIFSSIPLADQPIAHRMLLILFASLRSPKVEELNIMLAIESSHRSVRDVEQAYSISGPKSIHSVLGGLVKIMNGRIYLVHHTLKEHLMKSNCIDDNETAFPVDGLSGHRVLAEACIGYLLLEDFHGNNSDSLMSPISRKSGFSASPIENNTPEDAAELSLEAFFQTQEEASIALMESMADRFEFYDYSARHWTTHFARCQEKSDETLTNDATKLCSKDFSLGWFAYITADTRGLDEYPISPDTLVLCAYFGHHVSVMNYVSEGVASSQSGHALYWASRNGHIECVRRLLPLHISDTSSCYHRGLSPLAVAAAHGHEGCVQVILSSAAFDVNERDPSGRTPLSHAAGGGHQDVVSKLLIYRSIAVNLPDLMGYSPLVWAMGADSLPTVKAFSQDSRTDLGLLDRSLRTAVSWASEYGFSSALETLLKDKGIDINTGDLRGRTPLMYAVTSKDLRTVKVLTRSHRLHALLTDDHGRNAISWAASVQEPSILKHLLRHFPAGAEIADDNGWTPLAWTMNGVGYRQNAATLLPYSNKSLNARDSSGASLVSLAVCWRSFDIAELLISTHDVDINVVDALGRSVLYQAAAIGEYRLVRLILDRGDVNMNILSVEGLSPAAIAARNGYGEVCNLLQNCKG